MRSLLRSIRQFLSELKRRNVYRVAVTYVIVGFFVIEGADLVFPRIDLPPWTVTLVIALVGVGFPIALVIAWAFEVTPEGVRVEEAEASGEEVPAPSSTTRDLWVGMSVLVLLLLGAWWMWGSLGGEEATNQAEGQAPKIQERSIAVLPFEVSGSGAEEWRDGMVTALSLNLDGAAGLRAVAARTIFAAWKKKEGTDVGLGTQEALEVAREVGARYSVVGEAVQLGEDLRFGTEVYNTSSGERLGQVEVRGTPESLTALTDRLTRKILGLLLEKSDERVPSVDFASITTGSLGALKDFLAGERHYRAGEYEAAIDDYERAVEQDSTFALAYARLSASRGWAGEPGVDRALRRAREIVDQLPRREGRLVRARYIYQVGNRPLQAADSLRRLTNEYPDDPSVWYWLGEVLMHGFVPRGFPEAEKAFQRAVRLDPGLAPYHHHLVQLAFAVRHDSTLAAKRIQAHPTSTYKLAFGRALDLAFGSSERQETALARLDSTVGSAGAGMMLATTLLSPLDRAVQERVLRRLVEREDVDRGLFETLLVTNNLERGQVKAATARLQELELSSLPGVVSSPRCILSGEASLGTLLPDSLLRARLDPSRIGDGNSTHRLMCAGIYLLEAGRGEELSSLTARLRKSGQEKGLSKEAVQRQIDELEGYRAFKAGDYQQAKKLWSGQNESWYWGALWRGDLYRELGDLQKAEGWYYAGWFHPVAQERLGRLYEEMGRPEKARAAYERFVEAWKDADPELQDRVEKARERFEALGEKKAAE